MTLLNSVVELLKKGKNSIVIYGATASGKSALALQIANAIYNSVVINADSMQVYREIPIITAQPLGLPNHKLYGIISCSDSSFSVARWLKLVVDEMHPDKVPIIVGGTGMYISSLLNGFAEVPDVSEATVKMLYEELGVVGLEAMHNQLQQVDPETANKICDPQRTIRALSVFLETGKPLSAWKKTNIKLFESDSAIKILVKPQRSVLYERINNRFVNMIDEFGAIEEVERLIRDLPGVQYPKAIGIKEIENYLNGLTSKAEMVEITQRLTRNYAKRQETWFRNQLTDHDFIVES